MITTDFEKMIIEKIDHCLFLKKEIEGLESVSPDINPLAKPIIIYNLKVKLAEKRIDVSEYIEKEVLEERKKNGIV